MSAGLSRSTYYVLAFIVLAVVFWLWPNAAGKFIKIDPLFPGQEPLLRGVLTQPVTLRYAFTPKGPQRRSLEVHLVAYAGKEPGAKGPSDEKKPLAQQRIAVEFEYALNACDAKVLCDLRLIVKRVRAGGHSGNHYDSNSKTVQTQLAPLTYNALIDTPIPVRVHALGKVESIDIKAVKDKLGKLATPPVMGLLNSLVQSLTNDLFIVFPEKPISLNETFESSELSTPFADLGVLKISRKYTLKGVSEDGGQVLLRTEMSARLVTATGTVKNPQGYVITLEGAKTKGWVLYGIKTQDILRSATDIEFSFSVANDKERLSQMSHFKALYRRDP